MLHVGVIGLGMMGNTHLDVYARRSDVKVVAISDADPARLSGQARAAGNVPGQAQGAFDLSTVRKYAEGMDLIRDKEVQLVDVCLPTPLHRQYAEKALKRGKHVLVEKPLARTARDAFKLAARAEKAGTMAMPAMCIRFWPGWVWLKEAVADKRFGKVLAASFRRVASHPGGFYTDGAASGGAILDLHIHDTDFIQWCFGPPEAVTSKGYTTITGQPDHVVTHYHYSGPDAPVMVTAEGSWAMAKGFPFNMQYTVNFERATAVYDLAAANKLMLYEPGKDPTAVEIAATMGYEHEIAYFLDCIARGDPPRTVTLRDGAVSVAIVEAEAKSIAKGRMVKVKL